jgi:transcription initiation factor IIF auxiliary subunit
MKYRLALAVGLLIGCALSAQNIGIDNTAKYLGNGQYSWTVFATGSESALSQVSGVKYTLHPTFPDPVVWGKGANFSYTANGWGEFDIAATIYYKDKKRKPTSIVHPLKLFAQSKDIPRTPQRKR